MMASKRGKQLALKSLQEKWVQCTKQQFAYPSLSLPLSQSPCFTPVSSFFLSSAWVLSISSISQRLQKLCFFSLLVSSFLLLVSFLKFLSFIFKTHFCLWAFKFGGEKERNHESCWSLKIWSFLVFGFWKKKPYFSRKQINPGLDFSSWCLDEILLMHE